MSDLEVAEKSADRMRDELLRTLVELDRRREKVTDWHYWVERNRGLLIGIAGTATLLVVASVGVRVARHERRLEHLPERRRRGLVRAWYHPERVARRRPPSGFAARLGRVVGSAVVMQFARRAVARVLSAR